jgi:pimeloyl-ACP methyl ester carboxylesterase
MMLAIARQGYQVIAFEGPGQGGALEASGLPLTRDWQLPIGAVLDHFGLEQVTLLGISLGGGLAIRAAAGEPRIARVICDDILTDFLACNLRQFPAGARIVVTTLLRLRASRLLNVLLRRKMDKDPLAEWGITQGASGPSAARGSRRPLRAPQPARRSDQCAHGGRLGDDARLHR